MRTWDELEKIWIYEVLGSINISSKEERDKIMQDFWEGIQKEAWNEAIEFAAKNAEPNLKEDYQRDGRSRGIIKSILKCKK